MLLNERKKNIYSKIMTTKIDLTKLNDLRKTIKLNVYER